jgi:hypothetical protein
MNTITSTTTTTTYTVVAALFAFGKFEVEVTTRSKANNGVVSRDYLRNQRGYIRLFSSRNGARKAITRQLRKLAGEPGALHR